MIDSNEQNRVLEHDLEESNVLDILSTYISQSNVSSSASVINEQDHFFDHINLDRNDIDNAFDNIDIAHEEEVEHSNILSIADQQEDNHSNALVTSHQAEDSDSNDKSLLQKQKLVDSSNLFSSPAACRTRSKSKNKNNIGSIKSLS